MGCFGIGLDNNISSYEESANYKLNNKPVKTTIKLHDVDMVPFLKWIVGLKKEEKNMEFIVNYLKTNNYNITEEIKSQITETINGKDTKSTKKR